MRSWEASSSIQIGFKKNARHDVGQYADFTIINNYIYSTPPRVINSYQPTRSQDLPIVAFNLQYYSEKCTLAIGRENL